MYIAAIGLTRSKVQCTLCYNFGFVKKDHYCSCTVLKFGFGPVNQSAGRAQCYRFVCSGQKQGRNRLILRGEVYLYQEGRDNTWSQSKCKICCTSKPKYKMQEVTRAPSAPLPLPNCAPGQKVHCAHQCCRMVCMTSQTRTRQITKLFNFLYGVADYYGCMRLTRGTEFQEPCTDKVIF